MLQDRHQFQCIHRPGMTCQVRGMRRDDICLYLGSADRAELRTLITNRNAARKLVWRAGIVLATAGGQGTFEIKRWSWFVDQLFAALSCSIGFMSGGGFQVRVLSIIGLCRGPPVSGKLSAALFFL